MTNTFEGNANQSQKEFFSMSAKPFAFKLQRPTRSRVASGIPRTEIKIEDILQSKNNGTKKSKQASLFMHKR